MSKRLFSVLFLSLRSGLHAVRALLLVGGLLGGAPVVNDLQKERIGMNSPKPGKRTRLKIHLEGEDDVDSGGADEGGDDDVVPGLLDRGEDPGERAEGEEEDGHGGELAGVAVAVVGHHLEFEKWS